MFAFSRFCFVNPFTALSSHDLPITPWKDQFPEFWTWNPDITPIEPVLGRTNCVESEFEVKNSQIWQLEGKHKQNVIREIIVSICCVLFLVFYTFMGLFSLVLSAHSPATTAASTEPSVCRAAGKVRRWTCRLVCNLQGSRTYKTLKIMENRRTI